jgi:zinc/manganese transport system ATP-binding protein
VRLGLDGHRWGLPLVGPAMRERVGEAIAAVGASGYADAPIGLLSGGEQQRLRIAQAIAGRPAVLLCDEPLLSLDPAHQHGVTELLDLQRRENDTTVLFVTHEINPVLPYVDRVLYLAEGRWAAGHPDEVFTSERLSALYGTAIDVLRVRDRIVVVGADHEGHHH